MSLGDSTQIHVNVFILEVSFVSYCTIFCFIQADGCGSSVSSSASSSQGWAGGSPLSTKDVTKYRRQYERSLEQDVLRGRMSVADYHEQRAGMQGNDLKGVDDGHSRVDGRALLMANSVKLSTS